MVRDVIECTFDQTYWVTAELSEVRVSAKGHCFLELIEKSQGKSTPKAKAGAVIMNYLYPMLKMSFEDTTGQAFCAGIKVLLNVEISFNEIYGYSLVVKDIDPTYTLGSLAQLRKEILARLANDGILEMNQDIVLPPLLQRIAIISSATAAGYGDFCNQIDHNKQGFRFIHKLFPATMQGVSTAPSVIKALDDIAEEIDNWDLVVIIRGGGAVSDLAGFEDYDLAACCAQFPLPIITGIGHERDTTVLDFVANTHLKTPTAVAAFLLDHMGKEAQWLSNAEAAIMQGIINQCKDSKLWLANYASKLNDKAKNLCHATENTLNITYERVCRQAYNAIRLERHRQALYRQIKPMALRHIATERQRLKAREQAILFYDPEKILNLGYTITRADGHLVDKPADITPGTTISTTFAHGRLESVATRYIKDNKNKQLT